MFRKLLRIHAYSRYKSLISPLEIARYIRTATHPKINIGCGKNILSGWLNVDLYPTFGAVRMNVLRKWPFKDNTLNACFCEHMIEHVPKRAAEFLLREAFRTLKPGSTLRVVTPDLSFFANLALEKAGTDGITYIKELERFSGCADRSACDAVNEIFYNHGHSYIYTVTELSKLLTRIGFSITAVTRGGHWLDPAFDSVDGHVRVLGQAMNEIEAFAVEACKPLR
jgi:SAM-dependent methyltransferase